MTQISRPWDGTVNGDAADAPYTSDEWAEIQASLSASYAVPTYLGGVCRDELNELAVSGITRNLSVATGRAMVVGHWYESDAIEALTMDTTPSTRADMVVLRLTYATPNVRLALIKGTDGSTTPPALTNNSTYWDIPLAKAVITGTVVVITDMRSFVPWHGNQSSETTQTPTAHTYSQIANAPAAGGTPTNIVQETAASAGTSSTYAAGNHVHGWTAPPFGYKVADTTVTNNTTVANDPELKVTLVANKKYIIEALLLPFNADDAPGLKFDLTIPSGTILSYAVLGQDPVNAPPTTPQVMYGTGASGSAPATVVNIVGLADPRPVLVRALVSIGAGAGDAHIRWAQNVASPANGTIVKSGSYMVATYVG